MPETYFTLVRREPLLTAFWRQNDPAGSPDMTDYGSRYGLTGIYTSRAVGPALIQGDSGSASSLMTAGSGSADVANTAPLEIIGDISIEAWIAPYAASETVNIVSKQNSGATFAGPYALKLLSGQISFSLGNGTTSTVLTGAPAPPVSIPSHVVATSFRGVTKIYLNGVVIATGSLGAQAVADAAQPLIIGKTPAQNGVDLISEVALYNGALSARRIARHFTIGQQVLSDPAHFSTVDPPASA